MARLRRDLKLRYMFGFHSNDGEIPELYVRTGYEPEEPLPEELEASLVRFERALQNDIRRRRRCFRRNLPRLDLRLLSNLQQNLELIVVPTDKNLGPAVMERRDYVRQCLTEHLLDRSTYRQLSPAEAHDRMNSARITLDGLLLNYHRVIHPDHMTYFDRSLSFSNRIPQFYGMPKVHKNPMKLRPVTSSVGSRLQVMSVYLDHMLQKVVHLCPCYLRDSWKLMEELRLLGRLPPTARLITSDATSMYTNIFTSHGLSIIRQWLLRHEHELPKGFIIDFICDGLKLVMENNVFQFGDTWWLQISGTAMGTSVACIYATIYFSFHEETKLLVPSSNLMLFFYRRFIDDAFAIMDCSDPSTYERLVVLFNQFGEDPARRLQWKTEKPSREVNFLDLTIKIDPTGMIVTKTYQKPMNLHLFIPAHSAHPAGSVKGLVFSQLRRFWLQNTSLDDFSSQTNRFYEQLCRRGHDPELLRGLFLEAAARLDSVDRPRSASHTTLERWPNLLNNPLQVSAANLVDTPARHGRKQDQNGPRTFMHIQYHPQLPARTVIQKLFRTDVDPHLPSDHQLTIAFSRAPNLGDRLWRTRLKTNPGSDPSSQLATTARSVST